jgi:hypothetical protein
MNYKNLTELKKVLSGDIYRHVGLYTADGQKIKPFNTKIASYPDNVKDIIKLFRIRYSGTWFVYY